MKKEWNVKTLEHTLCNNFKGSINRLQGGDIILCRLWGKNSRESGVLHRYIESRANGLAPQLSW